MEKRGPVNHPSLPEALGAYAQGDFARFHMPGHKGRGMDGFLHGGVAKWDVTELSCTDNLHTPEGAIANAQEKMAAAYGAKRSFLVVNGSTAAIHAMILSLDETDRLLLSRDCHKSAIAGAALAGRDVCFYMPEYAAARDLLGLMTPAQLDRALADTGATAALITSPNYFGLCADIAGLAEVAHRRGALLLVDGAHGAHFAFSKELPEGNGGHADLFCHSQHKTLNALTQAASLHVGACRVDAERVMRMLAMIETTSPSYLLMASLDWATYTAARADWAALIRAAGRLRAAIDKLPGLSVFSGESVMGAVAADPTRLVIDVTARGLTGYEAQRALEQGGVYVEMADRFRLVLILSPEDDPAWYDALPDALAALPYGRRTAWGRQLAFSAPERCMGLREASFARARRVPLAGAAGCIAAEAVGVYPPGVALRVPGERLDGACVAELIRARDEGARLFGVLNGEVTVVDA